MQSLQTALEASQGNNQLLQAVQDKCKEELKKLEQQIKEGLTATATSRQLWQTEKLQQQQALTEKQQLLEQREQALATKSQQLQHSMEQLALAKASYATAYHNQRVAEAELRETRGRLELCENASETAFRMCRSMADAGRCAERGELPPHNHTAEQYLQWRLKEVRLARRGANLARAIQAGAQASRQFQEALTSISLEDLQSQIDCTAPLKTLLAQFPGDSLVALCLEAADNYSDALPRQQPVQNAAAVAVEGAAATAAAGPVVPAAANTAAAAAEPVAPPVASAAIDVAVVAGPIDTQPNAGAASVAGVVEDEQEQSAE